MKHVVRLVVGVILFIIECAWYPPNPSAYPLFSLLYAAVTIATGVFVGYSVNKLVEDNNGKNDTE